MSDIRITDAVASILARTEWLNEEGETPAKIAIVNAGTAYQDAYRMPARSRANRYTLVEKMMVAGLLEHVGKVNEYGNAVGAYALKITDKGLEALASYTRAAA